MDTFEEEEPIDMVAVADQLLEVEEQINSSSNEIMRMLQDLVSTTPQGQTELEQAREKMAKIWLNEKGIEPNEK